MDLILPGKVSESTLQLLSLEKATNTHWYFADYASCAIPVGTQFSKIINTSGEVSPMLSCLTTISPQFGKVLQEIPESWKTIVPIQFSNPVDKI